MNVRTAFLAAALLIVPCHIGFANPEAEPWIAKARAAIGNESALQAVTSVRYLGTLEYLERVPTKADPTQFEEKQIRLGIDIVFQKPYRTRTVLRAEKITQTSLLNGYDGWIHEVETGANGRSQFTMLDPTQIRELRANTWQNLAFFQGIEALGGRVEIRNEAEVDGKPCVVLAFVHSATISFTRYFDKATGVLVKSVTANGTELIEQGAVLINGVRFPKTLIKKTPSGMVTTITFESIKVNEPLPDSDFAFPEEALR